jgi:hypothetical protein
MKMRQVVGIAEQGRRRRPLTASELDHLRMMIDFSGSSAKP